MVDMNKWYAILGELAVTYSSIEHNLRHIVASLIEAGSGFLAGPILVNRWPYSQTIQHARKYAEFRFRQCDSLLSRSIAMLNRADELRQTRNLFTHGSWHVDLPTSGGIRCLDFRLKNDGSYLHEYTFSEDDLQQELSNAKAVLSESATLYTDIRGYFEA